MELERFYVAREWHGLGLAQLLMTRVIAVASQAGAAALWLGVWERNARAIAFYRKFGFIDVGPMSFMLGSDLQTDRIMCRPIGNRSTGEATRQSQAGAPSNTAGATGVVPTNIAQV